MTIACATGGRPEKDRFLLVSQCAATSFPFSGEHLMARLAASITRDRYAGQAVQGNLRRRSAEVFLGVERQLDHPLQQAVGRVAGEVLQQQLLRV